LSSNFGNTGHTHFHNASCGHTRINHDWRTDFLRDGHLHSSYEGRYDEHILEVDTANPDARASSPVRVY
jgi:hypothetical protein